MRPDRSGFKGVDRDSIFMDPGSGVYADCMVMSDASDRDVYDLLNDQIPPLEVADYLDGRSLPRTYSEVLEFAQNLGPGADRFALSWLACKWRTSPLAVQSKRISWERLSVDIMLHSAGLMLGREGMAAKTGFTLSDAARYALLAMRAGFEPHVVADVLVGYGDTVAGFFDDKVEAKGADRENNARKVAMARRLQAEHFRRARDYRRAAFWEIRGGDLLAAVIPGDTAWRHYSRALADVEQLRSLGIGAPALFASVERRLAGDLNGAPSAGAEIGAAIFAGAATQPLSPIALYCPIPTPPPVPA